MGSARRDAVALPASVAVGSFSPVRRSTGSAGRSQGGGVNVMVTSSEISARKRGLPPLALRNSAMTVAERRMNIQSYFQFYFLFYACRSGVK